MADTRSLYVLKVDALKRLLVWNLMSKQYNMICVTEYPKCGASWLCQILSDYLQISFRRNEAVKLEKGILHGHHIPSRRFNKPICFIRDGRDVMVSYYYHLLIGNDKMHVSTAMKYRKLFGFSDYKDVERNLPLFIERISTDPRVMSPKFSWQEFVLQCFSGNYFISSYERMIESSFLESKRALEYLGIEDLDLVRLNDVVSKYSFISQTQRKNGDQSESSYLRKGVIGDWKNHFSEDSKEVFKGINGKALIVSAYEQNDLW